MTRRLDDTKVGEYKINWFFEQGIPKLNKFDFPFKKMVNELLYIPIVINNSMIQDNTLAHIAITLSSSILPINRWIV